MTDFSLSITSWYRQNKRNLPWRNTSNPYFIWLSEVILQQTRVDQGTNYYNKFIKNYPTIIHLANASEKEILNDWQGLGYYSRARNLHASAKIIQSKFKGVFPSNYNDILSLKGVGPYTAAAISSFAFNEKKAVVDGNVYRLLSRYFDISTPIDSTNGIKEFQSLANELIPSNNPGEHNQAIMELGSVVCSPSEPNCIYCPLNNSCLAFSKGNYKERPIKTTKVKIKKRYFHYLIFENQEFTLIKQRTEKDIWQNLFEFPLIETFDTPSDEEALNWSNQKSESIQIKHILSHQHIFVTFHHIPLLPKSNDVGIKIKKEDIQEYPLPRVIDKYITKSTFNW